jgi:putative DNA primase/helicase
MHFNKKTDVTNALLRISDSLAFGASARHVYGVVSDPANKRRLMIRAKNNVASESTADQALAYRFGLARVGVDPQTSKEIWAPHVLWEDKYVDITATEAMQAANENTSPDAHEEAKQFLHNLLAPGPMAVSEIKDAATGNGIAWRTLERAKRKLAVVAKKEGMDKGWTWKLPTKGSPHWTEKC